MSFIGSFLVIILYRHQEKILVMLQPKAGDDAFATFNVIKKRLTFFSISLVLVTLLSMFCYCFKYTIGLASPNISLLGYLLQPFFTSIQVKKDTPFLRLLFSYEYTIFSRLKFSISLIYIYNLELISETSKPLMSFTRLRSSSNSSSQLTQH